MRLRDEPARLSGYERMLLEELEAGVDIYATNTVTDGQPRAPWDRTVAAAEWGWQPEHDED